MVRQALLVIIGLGIANGIVSPFFVTTGALMIRTLSPGLLIGSPALAMMLASLLGSTLAIVVAGIPAALYERATGARETTTVSAGIWLAAMALLSMHAIAPLLRFAAG